MDEQLALRAMPGSAALPHENLSAPEIEVLQLLVTGASVTAIAALFDFDLHRAVGHR